MSAVRLPWRKADRRTSITWVSYYETLGSIGSSVNAPCCGYCLPDPLIVAGATPAERTDTTDRYAIRSIASGEIVDVYEAAAMPRLALDDLTLAFLRRAQQAPSIKRLRVKHRYPPDKQPCAIKLVLEQMEAMAPHYAAERTSFRS